MQRVSSVGVLSLAKMLGAIYALLGLLLMPFFFLIGIAGSMVGPRDNPLGAIAPLALGIMAPLFYGCLGFIGGAVVALLYNLMAKWLGGIEVNLQPTGTLPPIA
jgi:hypothetical protein